MPKVRTTLFYVTLPWGTPLLKRMRIENVMVSFRHFGRKLPEFPRLIVDSGAYSDAKLRKGEGEGKGREKEDRSGKGYARYLDESPAERSVVFRVMMDKIGDQPATCRRFDRHLAKGHSCAFVYYSDARVTPAVEAALKRSLTAAGAACFAGITTGYLIARKIGMNEVFRGLERWWGAVEKVLGKGPRPRTHLLGSFRIPVLSRFPFTSADISSHFLANRYGRFCTYLRDERGLRVSGIPHHQAKNVEGRLSPAMRRLQEASYASARKLGLDLDVEDDRYCWNIRAYKLLEAALARGDVEKADAGLLLDTPGLTPWAEGAVAPPSSVAYDFGFSPGELADLGKTEDEHDGEREGAEDPGDEWAADDEAEDQGEDSAEATAKDAITTDALATGGRKAPEQGGPPPRRRRRRQEEEEKAAPPTGVLPALKMPDPAFLLDRLEAGESAGILSRRAQAERVGEPEFLVNEVAPLGFDRAFVWAVVKHGAAEAVADLSALDPLRRAGVDALARQEFAGERDFFYLPLELVERYEAPLPLKRPPAGRRFGAEVDLERDVAKAAVPSLPPAGDDPPEAEADDEGEGEVGKRVRQPFGAPAGKSAVAGRVAAGLPRHRTYVEPFAGGAAVLFAKAPSSSVREVLADLDPEVVGAFSFLQRATSRDLDDLRARDWRSTPEQLRQAVALQPRSDAERFWRLAMRRYSGWRAASGGYNPARQGRVSTLPGRLEEVQRRLAGVVLRRQDWRETLREFDAPDSFFYLDPPWPSRKGAAPEGLEPATLAAALATLKGTFLLHYDPAHADAFRREGWGLREADGLLEVTNAPDRVGKAAAEPTPGELAAECRGLLRKLAQDAPGRTEAVCRLGEPGPDDLAALRAAPGRLQAAAEALAAVELVTPEPSPGPGDPAARLAALLPRLFPALEGADELHKALEGGHEAAALLARLGGFSGTGDGGSARLCPACLAAPAPEATCRVVKVLIAGVGSVPPERLDAERLRDLSDGQLREADASLHGLYDRAFGEGGKGGENREVLVNAHLFVLAELRRRRLAHEGDQGDPLDAATLALAPDAYRGTAKAAGPASDRTTAAVYPGGQEDFGSEIALSEVLPYAQDIVLRAPAVYVVGGLAVHGRTRGDLDLLVRGPLDEATRRVVEFRLGRMLPPDLSQRVQFLDDELGGPFTDHVELYDLVLRRREDLGVKRMRLEKADDPLLDLPPRGSQKRSSALQYHFRGRSLHADLRFKVADDYLVGWTLALQREGRTPDVNSVAEAKQIAATFSPEGSRYSKPFLAPARLWATPKARQPVAWLNIEAETFAPGSVGATRFEEGTIVLVDRPRVEWGLQKPYSHEYFLTGKGPLVGILFFRLLVGEGEGDETPARTPEGEAFWTCTLTRSLLPGVLKPRAVETGDVPPQHYSGLPATLAEVVPSSFRYWEAATPRERREVRDALVGERFFTEAGIRLVDGEFRRVVQKLYVYTPQAADLAKGPPVVDFALSRQTWQGQTVIRGVPSRTVWHLVLDGPGEGLRGWELQADPLEEGERVAALAHDHPEKELLHFEGEVKPGARIGGEVLNPTRATPSDVALLDRGKATILDDVPGRLRVRFAGRKLHGAWTLVQEEERSPVWTLGRGELPGRRQAEKEAGEGAEDGRGRGDLEKRTGSRGPYPHDECMFPRCSKAPEVEVVWADGRGRAWFCKEHLARWRDRGEPDGDPPGDREIIREREVEGGRVGPRYGAPPLAKAIPLRDGVQVWDPDRRDPEADRTQLRPLALFRPQKPAPRPTNEFRDPEDALAFATPAALRDGILVEPKWNGFRVVAEKAGGRVLIFTEDTQRDISPALPGVTRELAGLRGDYVLDAELMAFDGESPVPRRELARFRGERPTDDAQAALCVHDALYLPGPGNLTAKTNAERRAALEAYLPARAKHLRLSPARLVHREAALREALRWASHLPGSEGAMLKLAGSTYSLGGENDGWAKLKLVREVLAIVYRLEPVEGSPGVHTLYCAVGPIPPDERDRWREVVEVAGKLATPIGRTFNTKADVEVGSVVRVEVTELLSDQRPEAKRSLTWFTPTVVEGPVERRPMTPAEAEALLLPGEVKKLLAEAAVAKDLEVIAKAGDGEHYALGVVLEPTDEAAGLKPDAQHDVYSAEEVQRAAHYFMEAGGRIGFMHREIIGDKARVLETYLAPVTFELPLPGGGVRRIREGTWLLALRVLDADLWQAVRSRKFAGLSVGGTARREAA